MIPSRSDWTIPEGVTYLNHGSFGPAPRVVQQVREEWSRRLESQPMDFFIRQLEPALDESMKSLATFLDADANDMVFVDNATVAMNIVAESTELKSGDEVLLNDHEYGAVFRIWRQKCEQTGARPVCAQLGTPVVDVGNGKSTGVNSFTSADEIIEPIFRAVTEKTRLIVVSHITSPTAIIFPLDEICQRARERGIRVCIDGPHAIAMQSFRLRELDCDFYCASLHKWLSAPFGSGFLYVQKKHQHQLQSHMISWGRSLGGRPQRWQDALNWLGTRDPAPFLAVPAAIKFLEQMGITQFQQTTHQLACVAREKLQSLFGRSAQIPDSPGWYGSMISVPLPDSDYKKPKPNAIHPIQQQLWDQYRIEALITECGGKPFFRVSFHLYNTADDINYLIESLRKLRIPGCHK